MAVLELVISGNMFNQLTVNRFHYISSGDSGAVTPSWGLVSAAGFLPSGGGFPTGTMGAAWQDMVGGAFEFVSAYARNLYSVSDFFEIPFPTRPHGNGQGADAAPFLAYGFLSGRIRTDIRRSFKRFAGVEEEGMGDGGALTAYSLGKATTLAARMSEAITYSLGGASLSYAPAVLGLEKYTTPSGKPAYRPYATEALQLEHVATGLSYSPYSTVRSQVSRQYGRGA